MKMLLPAYNFIVIIVITKIIGFSGKQQDFKCLKKIKNYIFRLTFPSHHQSVTHIH